MLVRLEAGTRLGPYEILAPLGAGGMGEVFRARDTRLEREVALKVVRTGLLADDAARRRFRKEALALAKLKHAHVAWILDVVSEGDIDALVMELVEGESLSDRLARGPLPESEVLRLGIQLADGLGAAHAEGVVHCDLKPANLRVTPDGELKILDFGLARLRQAPDAGTLTAAATESATAFEAVGTLPYMAPEQLRAEPLDARTDLWAAGAVLCELATGRRPFPESVPARLTDAILHSEPAALSGQGLAVSTGLRRLLRKCLQKAPEDRYLTAAELRGDLEALSSKSLPAPAAAAAPGSWSRRRTAVTGGLAVVGIVALSALWRGGVLGGRAGTGRIDSLAVLPLANLSKNPEQEYFADGMTEALIAELAKIRALKVISRTSVMQYKNVTKPLPEIAKALGVKGIIEGSVMREGESVRITVQLIEADSDRHLWAESYTREAKSILSLQSEVASAIAREVRVAVTPEEAERLSTTRTVDPEAYREVLLGDFAMNQSLTQRTGIEKSIEHYRRAIALDPRFALAHARLANGLQWVAFAGLAPTGPPCADARAEAEKALQLDPHLAEAHALLAGLRLSCDFDWSGAEADILRAIELSPGLAVARYLQSNFLGDVGRHDEALEQIRIAEQLDPLSEQIGVYRGQRYWYARRYEAAVEQFQKVLSVHPDSVFAKWSLANTLTSMKRYDEAIATHLSRKVSRPDTNFTLGLTYGLAGRKAEARKVLDFLLEKRKSQFVPPTCLAVVYGGLGEMDEAFEWLGRAYDERAFLMQGLRTDPLFDVLRGDPRFDALLRKMNLPK
ncbi:MAG TPA: protein kinase [Thermoanaerobaculia bacterium]|nr:protein kinase [Thermoanaerobaculia bacterium]